MTFFESLLALLFVAVLLLQISRRLSLPYPSMLAIAGAAVGFIPGVPNLPIDPDTALTVFIAPALMDAAFDFPARAARRLWAPLLAFAVGGVVITAGLVAWVGWAMMGLPLAAALVLGAIIAPPDAAAATAVLSSMSIPRTTDAVLRGESLFNDAAALLLFGAAMAVQSAGGLSAAVVIHLVVAVPGGILFGMAAAWVVGRVNRFVTGTLGGNLLQFIDTFLIWIIAQHLGLSIVLSVVAFAMTLARGDARRSSVRMRVHSWAVWSAVVFVLNVMAFLFMGMQVHSILGSMRGGSELETLTFAGVVVIVAIMARFLVTIGFNRAFALYTRIRGEPERATVRQAVLAGWCGMRGLLTLATAFALPTDFPQRDVVVLMAFAVVFATLVIQGLTLAPLIRWLGLDRTAKGAEELGTVRGELAAAALARLGDASETEAEPLLAAYRIEHGAFTDSALAHRLDRLRTLSRAAIAAQRDALDRIRSEFRVSADEYNALLEEIDWRELNALPDDARRMEES